MASRSEEVKTAIAAVREVGTMLMMVMMTNGRLFKMLAAVAAAVAVQNGHLGGKDM